MPNLPVVLLIIFAVVFAWNVFTDGVEYRRFIAANENTARRRFYATWVAKTVLLFGVGPVVCLFLLGRLSAFVAMPSAFRPLADAVRPTLDIRHDVGFLIALAVLAAGAAIVAIQVRRATAKAKAQGKRVVIGAAQPMLPRDGAERLWVVLLSISAGIGEELSFRLVLPLLLVLVTGNALIAFAVATAVFGVGHLYQGWDGVVVTGMVGGVMGAIYLATGNIWIVVVLHALIDLNGLILMPLLASRKAKTATVG